jgi:hypothetical protein
MEYMENMYARPAGAISAEVVQLSFERYALPYLSTY